MDIEQHIQKYGPQNRYKNNFEQTNKQEHIRLFSEIVESIHDNGTGLNKITYHNPERQPVDVLLRNAEVVHLQDVANLIEKFYLTSFIFVIITAGFIIGFQQKKIILPSLQQQTLGILLFITISIVCIIIVGPTAVFYAMHEWVFPDEHQWFFYYQESLMTVLMKAPDLFAGISILITALGVIIYLILNQLIVITTHK